MNRPMTRSDVAMWKDGYLYYIKHPTEGKLYARGKTEIIQHLVAWEIMDGDVWEMSFAEIASQMSDLALFDNVPRARMFREVRSGSTPRPINIILEIERARKRKSHGKDRERRAARRLLAKAAKLAELPAETAKS